VQAGGGAATCICSERGMSRQVRWCSRQVSAKVPRTHQVLAGNGNPGRQAETVPGGGGIGRETASVHPRQAGSAQAETVPQADHAGRAARRNPPGGAGGAEAAKRARHKRR